MHLPALVIGWLGCGVSFVLGIFFWKQRKDDSSESHMSKMAFWIEVLICAVATVWFGGRIIYSAIPYNGALSWKIDEWRSKKEVKLEHSNFFVSGAEGVLEDLDEALGLPEELYLVNQYQMTFDKNGTIQTIYTFFYGRNQHGDVKTYLVDYDAGKDEDMIVWVDGEANMTFDEGMRLEPMLKILQKANCENQVKMWADDRAADTYEIVYYGCHSFTVEDGLQYLPGDVDGDGIDSGTDQIGQLRNGGRITGYEVSLHMPGIEEVTPIRYIMEPEYTSQEMISIRPDVIDVGGLFVY